MKRVFSMTVLGVVVLAVWAQQPKPEELPSISVEVEVVNIFFTVTDRQGRLITNLDKSDFTVEEEGHPQTIKFFSRQSDLPLTMGLLVDTSVSQGSLIDQERQASSQFFTQMLRVKKDQAFLISFDVNVDLLQDFTDSSRLLRAGLEKLRVNGGAGGMAGGPVPSSGKPRGTLLYDAVFLAAEDMLRHQVGRKTVVLITDGNDFGSRLTMKQAIAAAQKSDAILYSILFLDRAFYYRAGGYGMVGGFGNASALKKMSEETGGKVFEVTKKKSLKEIYDE
ncbi:MAG: VWA domain-containing protein, partial [Acidobacteria bacterium]|nr:VWA domain-containing protein [Acidobacteriota bacterium]